MNNTIKDKAIQGIKWNVVKVIIQLFNGTINSFFIAKILSDPKYYGQYSFYLLIANSFTIISMFGYNVAMLRIVGKESDLVNGIIKVVNNIKRLCKLFSITLPLFIGLMFILQYVDIVPIYITKNIFLVMFLCFTIWYVSVSNLVYMALKLFKESNVISILTTTSFTIIQLGIFFTNKKIDVNTFILIFCIINILIPTLVNIKFFLNHKKTFKAYSDNDDPESREMAKNIFLIQLCDMIIWDKSEMFFLNKFGMEKDIGLYGYAYNLTNSISNVIQGVYSNLCLPIFSELATKDKKKAKEVYTKLVNGIISITTVFYMALALFLNIIISVWLTKYSEAIFLIYILFFGKIFSSIGVMSSSAIYCNDKSRYSVYTSYMTSIVNIFFDFILINYYGAFGATMANTIAQCFGVLTGVFVVIRFVNYNFPIKTLLINSMAYLVFIIIYGKIPLIFQIIYILVFIIYALYTNKNIVIFIKEKILLKFGRIL